MQARPAEWWGWEALGDEPWRLLRGLTRTLDPKGIMNQGKPFSVGG